MSPLGLPLGEKVHRKCLMKLHKTNEHFHYTDLNIGKRNKSYSLQQNDVIIREEDYPYLFNLK